MTFVKSKVNVTKRSRRLLDHNCCCFLIIPLESEENIPNDFAPNNRQQTQLLQTSVLGNNKR